MVEVLDLLAEHKVLKKGRTPDACLEAGLVLNGPANIGGQVSGAVIHLVCCKWRLAAGSILTPIQSGRVRKGACCLGEPYRAGPGEEIRDSVHRDVRRPGSDKRHTREVISRGVRVGLYGC
jgi:hypothetical protein